MPIEHRPLKYGTEILDWDPFCEMLLGKGREPYIVIKDTYKAISANNVEFTTMTGNLTHLRVIQSSSYTKVDIVSSSSNDKSAAAGHIRSVRVWGVDSSNYLRVEGIDLSGTTKVSSTVSFYELGDIYHYTHGTGGDDAAGRIDVGKTGKVTVEVLSIGSNQRRSLSTRIPIPKYWRAKILSVQVTALDTATSTNSAVLIFPHYYDAYDGEDEDSSHSAVEVFREGKHFGKDVWPRIYGNDTTNSILEFYGKRHVGSETWSIKAKVALWGHSCYSAYKHLQVT